MDKLEIWANRRGEKLVSWARNALIRQARKEKTHEILSDDANFSALEALAILREMAGEELAQRATAEVEAHVAQVRKRVANDFS